MAPSETGQRTTFTHPHNTGGQGFYGNDLRYCTNYFTSGEHVPTKSKLLRTLGPKDPDVERERILAEKNDLLEGSCLWVFEQDAFKAWWAGEEQAKILWIHGDPGKGKTMIMSAAVDEISDRLRHCPDAGVLAYFFCQQQEPRLNTAAAVLKGLMYSLASRYDVVANNLQELVYNVDGKDEESQTFWTLQNKLSKLLELYPLPPVYLLVDALDEWTTGLGELLRFIIRFSTHTNVRWLVTSRNEAHVRELLEHHSVRTSLELNSSHVSAAVRSFIYAKVQVLSQHKKYSSHLEAEVRDHLMRNAHDTFLWVALVCKELEKRRAGLATAALTLFPAGLERLYDRMLTQVDKQESEEDANLCRQLLRFVAVAISPQELHVLPALSEFPEDIQDDVQGVRDLVDRCGSFLTVRYNTVHFVHQSAADFFSTGVGTRIFSNGYQGQHKKLTSNCIDWMERTLKKDICDLGSPGILKTEIDSTMLDTALPKRAQYACCHWLKHAEKGTFIEARLENKNAIQGFLRRHLLHWFETLALLGRLSEAVLGLAYLETAAQVYQTDHLVDCIIDARRFVSTNRYIIENAALQVYASALVFSPEQSITRRHFQKDMPRWLRRLPLVLYNWGSCYYIFEGHLGGVTSVAFSPDGKLVASGSEDRTIRLWDAALGEARGTLKGHSHHITSVVFSPDGELVASGSYDNTVRLWDAASGEAQGTLKGHLGEVTSVVFSPDGKLIASGSKDRTVRLWDAALGETRGTLEGHSYHITSVVFSPDGELITSGSEDRTVRLWDAALGEERGTLEDHSGYITSVAFSPDGKLVALGLREGTVRLWDAALGEPGSTLKDNSGSVMSVVFSPDGKLVASGSEDRIVRLWDAASGELQSTLEDHSGKVTSVVFSPDGKLVASGSEDRTVRLWDVALGEARGTLKGHSHHITLVVFSPDGELAASGSYDNTVRLWDAASGEARGMLKGHSGWVNLVVFSPDSTLIASGSYDNTVRLWDVASGEARAMLRGHSRWITSVVFSPDGKLVASGSHDSTIRLWDAASGEARGTLEGHLYHVTLVVFSPDGKLIASGSYDSVVRLWDVSLREARGTLRGHLGRITLVVFSPDGKLIASGSEDRTVRLWDAASGEPRGTLEGHLGSVTSPVFSDDNKIFINDNKGAYALNFLSRGFWPSHELTSRAQRYWIDKSKQWITVDGTKVLWLPPDVRPGSFTVRDGTIAIGNESGRVTFIHVDIDGLPTTRSTL